jgi:threonine dehydrogenase-like Zn-dependent dehydrogenase
VHYYIHGRNGDFAVREPLVLGHEAAGIIIAIGPDVDPSLNLKIGDRVAIECGKACGHSHSVSSHQSPASVSPDLPPTSTTHLTIATSTSFSSSHSDTDDERTAFDDDALSHNSADALESDRSLREDDADEDGCEYCASGRYNLCEGMRFCSSAKTFPHLDGTLQTTMNHSAHLLHRCVVSLAFLFRVPCSSGLCFHSSFAPAMHTVSFLSVHRFPGPDDPLQFLHPFPSRHSFDERAQPPEFSPSGPDLI